MTRAGGHLPLCLLLLNACLRQAHGELIVTKEPSIGALPPAWSSSGPAHSEHLLELTFAVRQRGRTELQETLRRVSEPSSPDYGQHLSNAEVQRLTAPAEMDIEAVRRFIISFGAEPKCATPNGDFWAASVTVETAERMLSARYVELVHSPSGKKVARAPGGYSLPSWVADAVDFVAPTTHIPPAGRRQQHHGGVPTNSSLLGFNSPKNLRKLYSIGEVEGKATGNKQAVTAFLEQDYSVASLRRFWSLFCGGIRCGKGDPKLVGDSTAGRPGTESMLDIETVTGMAGNVEAEFWGYKGRSPDNPENEPFLKWLEQLSSTSDEDVPKVFSTSYGENEASWSYAAADRLNVEFQKAGVRGISLLYASGDEGANCPESTFVPEGPASSPYVTSVGGTMPTASWPAPGGESAIGLSSGGFSNYWPMPEWQKEAVAAYLQQSGLPEASSVGYNSSGRAYPDISAQATNFFVWAGFPEPGVAGTSCAAPTVAGLVALLNDLRMQSGKSTLGFLNPLLYANAAAFYDVTAGYSSGCLMQKGWPAKPGWDAVTGVGTPNYARLAEVVMSLPAGRRGSSAPSVLVV